MINNLQALARTQGAAPMILHEDRVWDFATVADLALRGARWLDSIGIGEGDRVVVAVSNRPLFLFYWFSLAARGALAVPVAHDAFGDALRYVVSQSESKLVLTESGEAARLNADIAQLHTPLVSFDDEAAFTTAMRGHAPFEPATSKADTPLAILYTSGTTGQPKGVVIPAQSYLAAGRAVANAIGLSADDRILTFLPLHHANPQMYSVMSVLTVGCSIAIASRFSASRFLDQVRHYRATGFTYVGTVLSILAKEIGGTASTSLRWCVGGGAPRAVWDELAPRLGVQIHELYGMTETGGLVTINTREHYRFGSVGRAREDFEVVLLDDDDRLVSTGGIGEIAIRPREPYVMTTGYFRKPEETASVSGNFWFHTGDLGRFDADGYLHFEGRKKELIRRAGEMISPVTIELAALKHPNIADCAAVGIADPILEEDIKLVVVPRGDVSAADVARFLLESLPRHMVPSYVQFVDAIPKTPTQKVQRFKLAALQTPLHDVRPVRANSSSGR